MNVKTSVQRFVFACCTTALIASSGNASVIYDNQQGVNGSNNNTNVATISGYTVNESLDNRVLVVVGMYEQSELNTVTFDGTPMTKEIADVHMGAGAAIFYTVNPTGTGDITGTWGGNSRRQLRAFTLSGIDTTDPIQVKQKVVTSSVSPLEAISLTTTGPSFIVDATSMNNNAAAFTIDVADRDVRVADGNNDGGWRFGFATLDSGAANTFDLGWTSYDTRGTSVALAFNVVQVPEPATILILAIGAAALLVLRWKRG